MRLIKHILNFLITVFQQNCFFIISIAISFFLKFSLRKIRKFTMIYPNKPLFDSLIFWKWNETFEWKFGKFIEVANIFRNLIFKLSSKFWGKKSQWSNYVHHCSLYRKDLRENKFALDIKICMHLKIGQRFLYLILAICRRRQSKINDLVFQINYPMSQNIKKSAILQHQVFQHFAFFSS